MNFGRLMKQDATHWAQSGFDMYNAATFASPQAIKVRWEGKDITVVDSKGNEVQTKSKIFSTAVLKEGDQILLGTSVAADPDSVPGAAQILRVDTIPDIRALHTLYVAYL